MMRLYLLSSSFNKAARPWKNMVYFKAADLELCGQLTVFTAVVSAFDHCLSELF
jgi:hypothetical protein